MSYGQKATKPTRKIIARHDYNIGKYTVKVTAVKGYQEFYKYVGETLTINYKIGSQNFSSFNNDEFDEKTINLRPDCRLQKDSSMILLTTAKTNDHAPGGCGAASYDYIAFWLTDGKSSREIFSYSYSTCYSHITYYFKQSGKEISGDFYLYNTDDLERLNVKTTYWKNNSTYVIVIDGNFGSRKFYLYFDAKNKSKSVRLEPGEFKEIGD
jgi:hypothetical protein